MYVAITRARKRLYLSFSQTRMLHGQTRYNVKSRFFDELPEAALKWITPRKQGFGSGYAREYQQAWQRGSGLRVDRRRRPCRAARAAAGHGGPGVADAGPAGPARRARRVFHTKFGEGVVVTLEGRGADARAQVQLRPPRHEVAGAGDRQADAGGLTRRAATLGWWRQRFRSAYCSMRGPCVRDRAAEAVGEGEQQRDVEDGGEGQPRRHADHAGQLRHAQQAEEQGRQRAEEPRSRRPRPASRRRTRPCSATPPACWRTAPAPRPGRPSAPAPARARTAPTAPCPARRPAARPRSRRARPAARRSRPAAFSPCTISACSRAQALSDTASASSRMASADTP